MIKFDELFNEFFNRKKNDMNSLKSTRISEILNALTSPIKLNTNFSDDELINKLGQPTTIIETNKNGLIYKKMVWDTPHGQYVQIVVSEVGTKDILDNSQLTQDTKIKTLEEQLQDAVSSEDWELAIKLRDEIKEKNKIKRKKKLEFKK